MNCKKGDLAVVIKCKFAPENVGKVVQCLRLSDKLAPSPVWEVDRPLMWLYPWGAKTPLHCAPDHALLPISPPANWTEEDTQDHQLMPVDSPFVTSK
jgi:hypothetical protein